MKRGIFLLTMIVPLAACGGGGTAGEQTSPKAQTATTSAAPTPSATPTPTAAPMTARQLAQALKAKIPGMKITAVYTEESDPNNLLGRPGGYTSKVNFSDPRAKRDDLIGLEKDDSGRGGSIEVFEDPAAAKKRSDYIQSVSGGIVGTEYNYLAGGVLLRVTGNLTPKVAKEYKAALAEIAPSS
jgi:hypothetical protein